MSNLANLLRVTAREMAEHDEPPSWHRPIVEAADEIEKLRAALRQIRDQEPERQAWSVGVARAALGEKE